MMANVFQQVIRPVPSVIDRMGQLEALDASALRRRMGEAELGQMARANAMQDQERAQALEARNALAEVMRQSGGDVSKLIPAMEASGRADLWQQAQAIKKSQLEAEAKRASMAKDSAGAAKAEGETIDGALQRYRGMLTMVNSPQAAAQWMQAQYADPVIGPVVARMGPLEQVLPTIPTDPQGFAQWRERTAMGMDKFAQIEAQRRGQDMTAQTAAMNDARIRSEGAANRAAQIRGQNMTDARSRQQLEETAGGAATPLLGVPRPDVLPWANQSRAIDANKVKAKEAERGAKEIEKDEEAARAAAAAAADAKRFVELNARTSSGGASKVGAVRAVRGALSSDVTEMEGITARLAPAMRQPGSGATSDYDAKMFERGTVGLDKQRETNEAIAAGIIARAQQAQDYALFRQTYLEQNGTLQGADRFWRQYVNANPIFDPKANKPTINEARVPWRDYFAAGGQPAPASPKPAAPAAQSGGPYSDAEKERRYQEWKKRQGQ